MTRQWLSQTWQFAKDAFDAWIDDYAPSMGAALAYYTLFAIAPLLLIIITLAGYVYGADAARGQIVGELGGLLGKEGATAVEGLLKSASDPKTGTIAAIIGTITLLIAATTVFAELQSDLDRIWKVPAKNKPNGLWGLIQARFLSFGLIVGIGFLMIISLALSAALTAFGNWYGTYFTGWTHLLQVVNIVVSFGVTTAAFAMVYKLMPSVPIRWRDVWVGAFVTSFLFTLGKYLIGLYIGKAGVASGFGVFGRRQTQQHLCANFSRFSAWARLGVSSDGEFGPAYLDGKVARQPTWSCEADTAGPAECDKAGRSPL